MGTEVAIAGSQPLHKRSHEDYAWERSLATAPTLAAKRAGLSPRSGACSKLERNQAVLDRIAYLVRQEENVLALKRKRLEERQWLIRDADIAEFYEDVEEPVWTEEGKPVLDNEGNPVMRTRQRLKAFSELPLELRMCIEGLTYTEKGKPNLKLYSKQDAHRELCKLLGIGAVVRDDEDEGIAGMTDEQLYRSLAQQAAELGIDIKVSFEGAR